VDRPDEPALRGGLAALGISNDDFIRTTEPRHHRTVQRFMQAIYDNGYLRKGVYEGWYCVSCEAYYTRPTSPQGTSAPSTSVRSEWFTEENWFFELSRFEDRLLAWYEEHPGGDLPRDPPQRGARHRQVRAAKDISITRDIDRLGIPVPWDPSHVFYVWYDALVNYISAIGYGQEGDEFAKWWPSVCHLLGKDIVRFHCVLGGRRCAWLPGSSRPRGRRDRVSSRGRQEDGKERLQPDRSGGAGPRHRQRRAAVTTCAGTSGSAATASSVMRALSPGTTATSPTISAT